MQIRREIPENPSSNTEANLKLQQPATQLSSWVERRTSGVPATPDPNQRCFANMTRTLSLLSLSGRWTLRWELYVDDALDVS
jgi:hypothetical protein